MTLLTGLHILTLAPPPLLLIYALRLTAHHFARITPPLSNLKYKLQTVHWEINGDMAGFVDGFNVSWLAIASDRHILIPARDRVLIQDLAVVV